jgi:predicted esterase
MGWRLWVDPAAKAPQKVVVWLHPHGAAGQDLVGPLAPVFAKHGYALLEPLSSDNEVR